MPSATSSDEKGPAKIPADGKANNAREKARKRKRSEKEEGLNGAVGEDALAAPALRGCEDETPLPKKHKAKSAETQEDDTDALEQLWPWENVTTSWTRSKSWDRTSTVNSASSSIIDEELVETMLLSEITHEYEEPHQPTFEDRGVQKSTVERSAIDIKGTAPVAIKESAGDGNFGVEPQGDTLAMRGNPGGELTAKVSDASACQQEKHVERSSAGKRSAGIVDPIASQMNKISSAQSASRRSVRQFVPSTSTKEATEGSDTARRAFLALTKTHSSKVPDIASSSTGQQTPGVQVHKSKSRGDVEVKEEDPEGLTSDKNLERLFEELIDTDQLADETLSREYWGIGKVFEWPAIYLEVYKLII